MRQVCEKTYHYDQKLEKDLKLEKLSMRLDNYAHSPNYNIMQLPVIYHHNC